MPPYPPRDAPAGSVTLAGGDLFAILYDTGWHVYRGQNNESIRRDFIAGPQFVAVGALAAGLSMWPSIPAGQVSGPLQPGTGAVAGTPDILRNGQENDNRPLFQNKTKTQIWQVFAGIDQPQTYVYTTLPSGDLHGVWSEDQGPPAIQAGVGGFVNTWGWQFGGWESMYGDERAASMFFFPPFGSEVTLGMAVYNWSSQARTPRMGFVRNAIEVEALDPRDKKDATIIDAVLKSKIPGVIKWTAGMDRFRFQPGAAKVFGVPTVELRGREIRIGSRDGPVMEVG